MVCCHRYPIYRTGEKRAKVETKEEQKEYGLKQIRKKELAGNKNTKQYLNSEMSQSSALKESM